MSVHPHNLKDWRRFLTGIAVIAGLSTFVILQWHPADVNVIALLYSGKQVNPIQLVWFYKPPSDNTSFLLNYFDFFILTKRDEPLRDQLVRAGKNPVLQYVRLDAIHDPCEQAVRQRGEVCGCSDAPNNNNVAWYSDDICMIRDEHPDWFLRDALGAVMLYDEYVMMDPANQEWREFWLTRVRQSQEAFGWHGVFLDNVEASLAKQQRRGFVPSYTNESDYQAAVADFLSFISTTYFIPAGRPLYANIIELTDDKVWFQYLPFLQGAMIENWAVGWGDEYYDDERWLEQLMIAEQTQEQGKAILLIAQGTRDDGQRLRFAFASYLLVNEGSAWFRYTHSDHYGELWFYPEFSIELGEPLGSYSTDGELWSRTFTQGVVTVNPKTHESEIRLLTPETASVHALRMTQLSHLE